MRCFLSSSFSKEDKFVVDWFHRFLSAFPDVHVDQGGKSPAPPWDDIEELITDADIFCAVITERGTSWSQAVGHELNIAAQQKKTIIAFVENGVKELGRLPYLTNYKHFERRTLGKDAPDYLMYVYNARRRILKEKGLDRDSVIRRLEDCLYEIKGGIVDGTSTRNEL